MPPPKRMTANPVRPARHRAGQPTAESSSEPGSDDSEDNEEPKKTTKTVSRKISQPKGGAGHIISRGSSGKIDLQGGREEEARRRQAAARVAADAERLAKEQGFVTDEEEDEDGGTDGSAGSVDGEDESSEEEESSSEEEAPRPLMVRPKFVPKSQRGNPGGGAQQSEKTAEEEEKDAEEARRKAADELVEEQIKMAHAAKAQGKKPWESDKSDDEEDPVDDTDDLDPEAEYAAWKLRELKRILREREAIEAKERELAEIERRRGLTEEERAAEDAEHLARQREEREGRGKMAYMQKYFHKGAFYRDQAEAQGLADRDMAGARFADQVDRELLPQALQMRDMTKLGRKGASKYKDLQAEDTGRWGVHDDRRGGVGGGFGMRSADERFQPEQHGREGGNGANAMPLGERKSVPSRPDGPRMRKQSLVAVDREGRKREHSRDGDDRYDSDKRPRLEGR